MKHPEMFDWIENHRRFFVVQDEPLYIVVMMKSDGKPTSMMSTKFEEAWACAEKYKHELLYFLNIQPKETK